MREADAKVCDGWRHGGARHERLSAAGHVCRQANQRDADAAGDQQKCIVHSHGQFQSVGLRSLWQCRHLQLRHSAGRSGANRGWFAGYCANQFHWGRRQLLGHVRSVLRHGDGDESCQPAAVHAHQLGGDCVQCRGVIELEWIGRRGQLPRQTQHHQRQRLHHHRERRDGDKLPGHRPRQRHDLLLRRRRDQCLRRQP